MDVTGHRARQVVKESIVVVAPDIHRRAHAKIELILEESRQMVQHKPHECGVERANPRSMQKDLDAEARTFARLSIEEVRIRDLGGGHEGGCMTESCE